MRSITWDPLMPLKSSTTVSCCVRIMSLSLLFGTSFIFVFSTNICKFRIQFWEKKIKNLKFYFVFCILFFHKIYTWYKFQSLKTSILGVVRPPPLPRLAGRTHSHDSRGWFDHPILLIGGGFKGYEVVWPPTNRHWGRFLAKMGVDECIADMWKLLIWLVNTCKQNKQFWEFFSLLYLLHSFLQM